MWEFLKTTRRNAARALQVENKHSVRQFTIYCCGFDFFFLIYESKCGNLETYFLELLGSLCAFCIKKVRPKSEEKIRGESEEPLVGVLAWRTHDDVWFMTIRNYRTPDQTL
jgi:hypothetical protein